VSVDIREASGFGVSGRGTSGLGVTGRGISVRIVGAIPTWRGGESFDVGSLMAGLALFLFAIATLLSLVLYLKRPLEGELDASITRSRPALLKSPPARGRRHGRNNTFIRSTPDEGCHGRWKPSW
jgi:hypothetical protein